MNEITILLGMTAAGNAVVFATVVAAVGFLFAGLRAATANLNIDAATDQKSRTYPVAAGEHIYRDAYVGLNPAGYLKAFEPGDDGVGFAVEECDNSSGAAAALSCEVAVMGDRILPITSVALTDKNKCVYATADNTFALTGHPDAFVGRILHYDTTGYAMVRQKNPGELPPNDGTSILIDIDFSREGFAALDEATATSTVCGGRLKTACVGAGLTAGTTGLLMAEATGELKMLLDNDNEAENVTIETPQVFNITKGITADFDITLEAAGGAATDDVDFGLAGLSGGITATERANMAATTAGLLNCLFHLDANGLDLEAVSDDNASPIAETDTTVNLVVGTEVHGKIVCRVDGSCELWVNGVQKLSTTAFSVGASGLLAGIVNLEKSTGTGVPQVNVRRMRIAGAVA